jgi:hypothetical protein
MTYDVTLVEDLRDSVRDYRHGGTSETERENIRQWWKSLGIPNQFAALLRAGYIEEGNA